MNLESWGGTIFILAIVAILVMALFFVFCRRYEDGLVGNGALAFMAIACAAVLHDVWDGRFSAPDPVYSLLILTFSLFMLRHCWRFLMFHWHGSFGWKPPKDHRPTPTGMVQAK